MTALNDAATRRKRVMIIDKMVEIGIALLTFQMDSRQVSGSLSRSRLVSSNLSQRSVNRS
jgi:hypothetical protein